ncbi:FAD/NAD(P)-binding protein [Pontibacter sp. HJ8]
MNIAIIGGGLSGTLTAIHLLRYAPEGTDICLVEQDRYRMNRGIAYSSQLPFQPLNVPASAMSLFPDEPYDFFAWLTAHQYRYKGQLKAPVSPQDFVPRFIFGDYLKSRLQEAEAGAPQGVKLVNVYEEAVSVKQEGSAFQVTLRSQETMQADKVVLALGNFPPGHLPIPDEAFYGSSCYVASPWAAKGLMSLPADASLLLIGSSLTMVDLVGSLQAQGHTGKVYVVSRHGLLPQPTGTETMPCYKLSLPPNGPLSAMDMFRFIRHEIQEAARKGYTWRNVLDALREEVPGIWQAFSGQEKKRFLRHIRPFWETHRHRMPAASANLLQKLQAQGQLEVIAASIVDMQETGETACVTIRRRKQTTTETIEVSRVINCTGPQGDFTKVPIPLVQQLLKDGMIKPDPLSLGVLTMPDGTLVGEEGKPTVGLFTLGPPRKATLYESTALREIRQQAQALALELLQGNSTRLKAVSAF